MSEWAPHMAWGLDSDRHLEMLDGELRMCSDGRPPRVEWRRDGAGDLVVRPVGSACEVTVRIRGDFPDEDVRYCCGGEEFVSRHREFSTRAGWVPPYGLISKWLDSIAAERRERSTIHENTRGRNMATAIDKLNEIMEAVFAARSEVGALKAAVGRLAADVAAIKAEACRPAAAPGCSRDGAGVTGDGPLVSAGHAESRAE